MSARARRGEKALTMVSLEKNVEAQKGFDYGQTLPIKQDVIDKYKETTVKGSQFKQPLLEFSGACAGCGEDSVRKTDHSAVRRSYVHCQRNRMLLYLG